MFTDGFIYGIIIPVLPFSLPSRADIPERDVQYWTSILIASFGFAKLVGSPALGWLADRNPSKHSFLLGGLLLQGAAALLLGLGRRISLLVVSRLIQGLSAAIVYTGGFALLIDTVDEEQIGQWFGVIRAGENLGILISPIIGGILYGQLGWTAVFAIILVVVGVDIILRLVMIEKMTAAQWIMTGDETSGVKDTNKAVESPSQPTGTLRIDSPAIDESQPLLSTSPPISQHQPTETQTPTSTHTTPTLFRLLSKPRVLVATFGVFAGHMHITTLDSVLPRFLSLTLTFTVTQVGLTFIIWAFPSMLSSLGGMLSDRIGPRWIASSGLLLAATALALLPLVTHYSPGQVALACVLLIIDGVGFSLLPPPLASDMAAVVAEFMVQNPELASPGGDYGQVFSLFSCGVAVGTTAGPLLGGWLYRTYGWGVMGWSMAAMLALAAILVVSRHSVKSAFLAARPADFCQATFTGGKRLKSSHDLDDE